MPRALARLLTAFRRDSGIRMLTRASFFSNSNRTGFAPERSYSVRSAVPTNASASLSLLKVGIFFFIVLNFLSVHVASSNGPDILFTFLLADREAQKDIPPQRRSASGLEAQFLDPVGFVGRTHNRR